MHKCVLQRHLSSYPSIEPLLSLRTTTSMTHCLETVLTFTAEHTTVDAVAQSWLHRYMLSIMESRDEVLYLCL